jgi:hypothetical protein
LVYHITFMPTKEELQVLYANLPVAKLLSIVDDKFSYTDVAVAVAIEELAKRNVSEEEIKSYKDAQIAVAHTVIENNLVNGLSFIQKNLFYFLWLPLLNFAFKMNFRDNGYTLKLRQANYYSLCGFLSFMACAVIPVILQLQLTTLQSIVVWMAVFVPAYLLDERFNRHMLAKKFGISLTSEEVNA